MDWLEKGAVSLPTIYICRETMGVKHCPIRLKVNLQKRNECVLLSFSMRTGYSSVIEHVLCMQKVQGSIPSISRVKGSRVECTGNFIMIIKYFYSTIGVRSAFSIV